MATSLALDDRLIRQACRAGRHKTKKAAVTAALEEYIRRRKQLRALDLIGKIDYWPDYDHKSLRRPSTPAAGAVSRGRRSTC